MPRHLSIFAICAVGGLAACTSAFVPTPPEAGEQAAALVEDVSIVADTDALSNAEGGLVPVLVSVRNRSDRPVRVDRDLFSLVPEPQGPPLAPVAAAGPPLPETVLRPGEAASGYLVFRDPPRPAPEMTLLAQVVDAADNRVIGTAVLPLRPADPDPP